MKHFSMLAKTVERYGTKVVVIKAGQSIRVRRTISGLYMGSSENSASWLEELVI